MCEPYLSEDNTGSISANTRHHQLHWGDKKMGTAISTNIRIIYAATNLLIQQSLVSN